MLIQTTPALRFLLFVATTATTVSVVQSQNITSNVTAAALPTPSPVTSTAALPTPSPVTVTAAFPTPSPVTVTAALPTPSPITVTAAVPTPSPVTTAPSPSTFEVTEDCNPCKLETNGTALSPDCVASNAMVQAIIAKDSGCGRNWDPFCIVEYNDCYNQGLNCGADQQDLIDTIATLGGSLGRGISREQILSNCPNTHAPSSTPTQTPSTSPTDRPSVTPSQSPSGVCKIETTLNCTATIIGENENDAAVVACQELLPEQQPVCYCEECVRQLQFTYTGRVCDSSSSAASNNCEDMGPSPFLATYSMTSCADTTVLFAAGDVQQGDIITIVSPEGTTTAPACLPECLSVTISVPNGVVTQTFDVDSECDGGTGLALTKEYGAFESLGYSCSETDTHNCLQQVEYETEVCNIGSSADTIVEWNLSLNEMENDLLPLGFPQNELPAGDCAVKVISQDVNRCVSADYNTFLVAIATSPQECTDTAALDFGWLVTNAPTNAPTTAPTKNPTNTPTKRPTWDPSATPSNPPTPNPTKAPTRRPTAAPSASPSGSFFPSLAPSASPTRSSAPSFSPSKSPTKNPTKSPTRQPTTTPSTAPSGVCKIETKLNCTTIVVNEDVLCQELLPEQQPICQCEDCVRSLKFTYTGRGCDADSSSSGSNNCADAGPNPFIATYKISSCVDATVVVATGEVQQGDTITVSPPGGTTTASASCLPECLSVTLSVPTGVVTQTFEVDATCDGSGINGLVLTKEYGAFESMGYSCSDTTDTHNCIQQVEYETEVCNIGTSADTIAEWNLSLNEIENDLLPLAFPQNELPAGDCAVKVLSQDVNRCVSAEYKTFLVAVADSSQVCTDTDALAFGWEVTPAPTPVPTTAPTHAPTKVPTPRPTWDPSATPSQSPTKNPTKKPTASPSATPSLTPTDVPSRDPSAAPTPNPTPNPTLRPTVPPTPAPTPVPSPAPSPSPTSACVIDVNLSSCPLYDNSLDNDCQGRPWVITFRYNGGECAQSDNLQPRGKFLCTDNAGGPPTTAGVSNYIVAVPRDHSELFGRRKRKLASDDIYFAGTVAVGEKYTLNADREHDKLSADMTITIYDQEGGSILQIVDLHLSCSQPLFLFDKFGASQVTEWIETTLRVVSDKQNDVETGTMLIEMAPSTDIEVVKPVRLLNMTVVTNNQYQVIDYTPQVVGTVLGPGDTIELPGFLIDIDLSASTRYTFLTTIFGETVDGTQSCSGSSFLECTIGFNLLPVFPTMVPTPSPTVTPFPTVVPNSTTCELAADITCTVLSLEGVTCDQLFATPTETCPAEAELLVAYLQYDGSLGEEIFVEIACSNDDESTTTYIDTSYQTGDTILFRTRANSCDAVRFTISDADPLTGGTRLQEEVVVSTACPGRWTIGNQIASGLMLTAFIDTEDDGATFTVNVLEAEVEFTFVAENTGPLPLTIVSGVISDTISSTSDTADTAAAVAGTSTTSQQQQVAGGGLVSNASQQQQQQAAGGGGGGLVRNTIKSTRSFANAGLSQVEGLPVDLAPRTLTTLVTIKETINLAETTRRSDGEENVYSIGLSLLAQTNNQFALPCDAEASITFAL